MTEAVRRLNPSLSGPAERARALSEALSAASGKHLLISLRGHPDPDGIASALALTHIAQRHGVAQITVGYTHDLSHRENRALVKLLNIELRKMRNVSEVGKVDFLAFVDAHDTDPDLGGAQDIEVLAIIDHHRAPMPRPRRASSTFASRSGATATMFAEYLQELAPLDPTSEEDRRVATALMHGMATDTDDFQLARAIDFRAAGYLTEACDKDLLADLSRRLIAPEAMDVIARALASLFVRRNFAMAGVGFVSEGDRDTIAQAADFLVRREISTPWWCTASSASASSRARSAPTRRASIRPCGSSKRSVTTIAAARTVAVVGQGRLPHSHRVPRPLHGPRAALAARRARHEAGAPPPARRRGRSLALEPSGELTRSVGG
jgi:nanoRNase/pAp phosphatase (c-di-AMP/oligoRNAs hydrolase)